MSLGKTYLKKHTISLCATAATVAMLLGSSIDSRAGFRDEVLDVNPILFDSLMAGGVFQ